MKQILRTVAATVAITLGFNAQAQIPDYGVWPAGVTFTDINGTTHDIDAILDAGKSIVIDAFADWCGPCWTYHQGHALEDLYSQYGPSGTDELMVFGIEADPNEPESNISDAGTGQGDWTQGVTYPQANDDNIAGIINLAYYPTVILICPDRTVTEVGQISTSAHYSAATSCGAPASDSNDPTLLASESDEVFCTGESATMSVVLQNFGTTTLTSATIEVFDGGTSVATQNWSGSIATYEYDVVNLGTVSPSAATTYDIRITSTNDNTSNDEVQASIAPAPVLDVDQGTKEVTYDLSIDAYGSEVGFLLQEGPESSTDWGTLYSNAGSNPDVIDFYQIGTYTDGTTSISETFVVNGPGCHTAIFFDNYGDGYNYQTAGASIDIKGVPGSSISVDPGFGQGTSKIFDVQYSNSVDVNEMVENAVVYPNPATNNLNVAFTLQGESSTTIELVNNLGQVVTTQSLGTVTGEQTVALDVASLESGMYIVKVKTANGEITRRVSIVK